MILAALALALSAAAVSGSPPREAAPRLRPGDSLGLPAGWAGGAQRGATADARHADPAGVASSPLRLSWGDAAEWVLEALRPHSRYEVRVSWPAEFPAEWEFTLLAESTAGRCAGGSGGGAAAPPPDRGGPPGSAAARGRRRGASAEATGTAYVEAAPTTTEDYDAGCGASVLLATPPLRGSEKLVIGTGARGAIRARWAPLSTHAAPGDGALPAQRSTHRSEVISLAEERLAPPNAT
jgi:hypothetical protein